MSRISETIKNKNKVEKARRALRKNELQNLRNRSAFKAKMYDELKHIEIILSDKNVDSVTLQIPDKYMSLFSMSIYSDELAGYDVVQSDSSPNKFIVRQRYI